jgi:hypothetical protein
MNEATHNGVYKLVTAHGENDVLHITCQATDTGHFAEFGLVLIDRPLKHKEARYRGFAVNPIFALSSESPERSEDEGGFVVLIVQKSNGVFASILLWCDGGESDDTLDTLMDALNEATAHRGVLEA